MSTDTGEYDARKTVLSSTQEQEKVFAKHKERVRRTMSFKRLETMIERAYALAGQVIDDNRDEQSLQVLAEEVSGECGEFLALWNKDYGAFGDTDCMDPELVGLVEKLKKGE